MRLALGALRQKFPGFSEEKVVSILWVVETFTSRNLCPNVAYPRRVKTRQKASARGGLKLPAARPVDELRSSRYGERARCSIFMKCQG